MFGDEEFYEATTYPPLLGDGAEEFEGDEGPVWQRSGCDAVVCLVDCSVSMFTPIPATSASTAGEGHAGLPPVSEPSTFFSMAVQSIHKLLTEKLKYTANDVLAVVLYNTHVSSNPAGVPGVYVSLPPTQVGTACERSVEQLEAAGVLNSVAYETFTCTIGHSKAERHMSSPIAGAAPPHQAVVPSFSEALRVAQNALPGDCAEQPVRSRRVFVFTNDSDPARGSAESWEQCCSRADELGKMDVSLEVFGFGTGVATSVSAAASDASSLSFGTLTRGLAAHARSERPTFSSSELANTTSLSDVRGSFDPSLFWDRLQHHFQQQQRLPPGSTTDTATTIPVDTWARVGAGTGSVHVHAGPDTLHLLLNTVAHRVHPQRPFQRCELRIGGLSTPDDKSPVPRMAVSLFAPLVPAHPPPRELVEARTNLMVRRVVHLRAWNGADSAEGVEVQESELHRYREVGGSRVSFTEEERKAVTAVAAAGAPPGFSILFFKEQSAAVQRAHVVRRSYFLHPNVAEGGPHSLRFFVLLVRRLRAKGKVAIAQYRRGSNAAPRLVALVPSPDLSAHPEKRTQLPVEGLGLYVVPLPYADDLRPIPDLQSCAVVEKGNAPCLESGAVSRRDSSAAERVIEALSASYDIDAVANPALQRRYDVLRRLAGSTPPNAAGAATSGSGSGAVGSSLDGHATETATYTADSSLPDYEGMKLHARAFCCFQDEVLGGAYDASVHCPQPPAERCRPRSDGAGDEGEAAAEGPIENVVRSAVSRNALSSLRVAQLREYLRAVNVSVGGSTRKDVLLDLVEAHVRSTLPHS